MEAANGTASGCVAGDEEQITDDNDPHLPSSLSDHCSNRSRAAIQGMSTSVWSRHGLGPLAVACRRRAAELELQADVLAGLLPDEQADRSHWGGLSARSATQPRGRPKGRVSCQVFMKASAL